jgi:DNA-binding NtrC family response regulator
MTDRDLLVLVVDDDPTIREALALRAEDWGYQTCTASNLAEAETLLAERDPDLVVADVVLPDASELEQLRRLRADGSDRPVILVTAHGSIDLAVEAMKKGAYDFLTKPLDAEKLQALLASAASELEQRERIRALDVRVEESSLGAMVGESPALGEVFRLVKLLAENEASVLITGESGTGKEIVARTIHQLSSRAEEAFIAVNTAAIPEGLIESELFGHEKGAFTGATSSRAGCFEMADGGTLLLDEIAEMPLELQPKLLRIIEESSVRRVGGDREVTFDVRVLAATNQEPEQAVADGKLREDLMYRLNVFQVEVPPLRERPEDVPLLAHYFVRQLNEKHGLEVEGLRDSTLERLQAYDWPGNVRELRNVMERAVIVAGSGLVGPEDLPPFLDGDGDAGGPELVLPMDVTAREAEKQLILRTLDLVDGNKAEAARRLDLDPKTIRNKLKRYREDDDSDA